MVSGDFMSWVGGGHHRSEGWRGDVSVPNGSFSPQENSDVFLSAVDTDWKVGSAMRGAPHLWVLRGTAACGWGMLQGTERSQGCCCPPFHGDAVPGQCLCMGLHVLRGPRQEGTGDGGGSLPGMLCVGARMWLAGTWRWARDKTSLKQAISSQEGRAAFPAPLPLLWQWFPR